MALDDVAKGKFIVLDGTDGSGKGTQTDILIERLRQEGRRVEKADFPQYGQWSAVFVEKYLQGEFGGVNDVGAKPASMFYAADRFAASPQIREWLAEGAIVISNRYVSANKGHQLGKITDETEMREFLGWVNELEYDHFGIPVPDLTLFLHMTPEIGQQLVDEKEVREYTQGKKRDIHEDDVDHLRNAERAYLFCVENDQTENWKKVICFEGDKPRTREAINEDIYSIVTSLLDN